MACDAKPRSFEPVRLGKSEHHHTAGWLQLQQVKIGEIADQRHGGTMRRGKGIADRLKFLIFSIYFRYICVELHATSCPDILGACLILDDQKGSFAS